MLHSRHPANAGHFPAIAIASFVSFSADFKVYLWLGGQNLLRVSGGVGHRRGDARPARRWRRRAVGREERRHRAHHGVVRGLIFLVFFGGIEGSTLGILRRRHRHEPSIRSQPRARGPAGVRLGEGHQVGSRLEQGTRGEFLLHAGAYLQVINLKMGYFYLMSIKI